MVFSSLKNKTEAIAYVSKRYSSKIFHLLCRQIDVKIDQRSVMFQTLKPSFFYISLAVVILMSSLVFYALQHNCGLKVKKPSNSFHGECVDSHDDSSFFRALYFTVTLYTTIGYGDVVPCTWVGKMWTMIFASIGVPWTLLCVGKFGQKMAKWSDILSRKMAANNNEFSKIDAPIWRLCVAIVITVMWILLTSLVFYKMISAQDGVLDGNYFDALYFTVATLFTIGFGDYIPYSHHHSIVLFILVVIIGLSLVSMCIAMITNRLESDFDKSIRQIKRIYMEMDDIDIDKKNELITKKIIEALNLLNHDDIALI